MHRAYDNDGSHPTPSSCLQRLLGYLAGENEDSVKLPPTVPLNSVLLTADRRSETVKGRFFFAIYLPDHVQVSKLSHHTLQRWWFSQGGGLIKVVAPP